MLLEELIIGILKERGIRSEISGSAFGNYICIPFSDPHPDGWYEIVIDCTQDTTTIAGTIIDRTGARVLDMEYEIADPAFDPEKFVDELLAKRE